MRGRCGCSAEGLRAHRRAVNNARITQPAKTCDFIGADYDRILGESPRGTLYMPQAVLPAMQITLNRLGRADDIGGAWVVLASDLSLYCTGITLDAARSKLHLRTTAAGADRAAWSSTGLASLHRS